MRSLRTIGIYFLLLFCFTVTNAQISTSNAQILKGPTQISENYWLVGISTESFKYFSAPEINGRQRQNNWCWAACVQMVLNFHGLYITQEEIVKKIYGGLIDAPANETQMRNALSGWRYYYNGHTRQVAYISGLHEAKDISIELSWNSPLIVGLINPDGVGAHAYVVTGMYFWNDNANNNPIPDKIILRDPWPSNNSRQEISWNDFKRRIIMGFKIWSTPVR